MKLNYMTIIVSDIEASIRFYTELAGLGAAWRINPEGRSIAFLQNNDGETMLELISAPGWEPVKASGLVLSFLAEEPLEDLRQKALDLGYQPGEIMDEGPKPAHFKIPDPDGLTVEFGVQ